MHKYRAFVVHIGNVSEYYVHAAGVYPWKRVRVRVCMLGFHSDLIFAITEEEGKEKEEGQNEKPLRWSRRNFKRVQTYYYFSD